MANNKNNKDDKNNKNNNANHKKTKNEELKKKSRDKKNLQNTTRIRIDKERINDSDSLDTSFLEGRNKTKVEKDKKEKQKILKSKSKNSYLKNLEILKKVAYLLSILCLIILLIIILINNDFFAETTPKQIEEKPEETVIDDNYLFIGDFYTENMDIKDLGFSFPYVKISSLNMTTSDILENMQEKIYIYNPSAVILEVGIEEILQKEELENIILRIEKIIKEIQENRPYAKIYIESLYPVNNTIEGYPENYLEIDNDFIKEMNRKLQEKTVSLNADYIDLFSILSENNQLKEEYTTDGISLNENGYKMIWQQIETVLLENHK